MDQSEGHENLRDIPDSQLWTRWKQGEEPMFRELLRRYSDLVWSVCQRVLFREQDSEDAFQITFLTLFRRGDQINREVFGPWLRRVAFHAALQIRDHRIEEAIENDLEDVAEMNTALEQIELVERNLTIEHALNLLPPHLHDALVQFHFEGRSRGEIAENCNISESAVKSRLQQARKRLRQHLMQKGFGTGVVLSILGTAEFAKAATPDTLIEKTIVNVQAAASGEGLSTFLQHSSQLERKLFMSSQSLGIAKGAAIAIVTAIAVTLLSVFLNSHRSMNANAQQTTVNSNLQANQAYQKPSSTFTVTPSKPKLNSLTSTRPTLVPSQQPNSAPSSKSQPFQKDVNFAGTWKKGDIAIDIDPKSQVLKVAMNRIAGQPYKVNFACEYRQIGDMLVGVVLNCGFDMSGASAEMSEIAEANMTLSKFSDQPFMMRIKVSKNSLFIRDIRCSIPMELLGDGKADVTSLWQLKSLILGEFKKSASDNDFGFNSQGVQALPVATVSNRHSDSMQRMLLAN